MEWGLHIQPDLLLKTITEKILDLQDQAKAIMLGYGRCQAMDRLPTDFKIPVFYPDADDCIGVLLGQEMYMEELKKEAGTWFLPPGWTEMGMDFIFHELQLNRINEKGIDPLQLAHRMLKDYTRALFIETESVDNGDELLKKARKIANEFNLRLEKTEGSLTVLKETLDKALRSLLH
ncbi:MAG: DUF1638 domain-containing protein [Desulfatiglandaceae bacterium]